MCKETLWPLQASIYSFIQGWVEYLCFDQRRTIKSHPSYIHLWLFSMPRNLSNLYGPSEVSPSSPKGPFHHSLNNNINNNTYSNRLVFLEPQLFMVTSFCLLHSLTINHTGNYNMNRTTFSFLSVVGNNNSKDLFIILTQGKINPIFLPVAGCSWTMHDSRMTTLGFKIFVDTCKNSF